jgi:hypothetical protein
MTYQVDIKRNKFKKAELTRVLRTLSPGLKLKQVVDIVDYINNHGKVTIVAGVHKKVANHIKKQISIKGIEVVVNKSSIDTPMVVFPSTNRKWQWGKFKSIEGAI